MSFLGYIEKIRQKPESYRTKILFASTIFITALIGVVWLTLVYSSSLDITGGLRVATDMSPLALIKDNLKDIYEVIRQK